MKPLREAHTPNTKKGMGDYYGTSIKNPVGKMRSDSVGMSRVSTPGLKKPPRKLA